MFSQVDVTAGSTPQSQSRADVEQAELLREVLVGYDAAPDESEVLDQLLPFYTFLRRLAAAEWNLDRGGDTLASAILAQLRDTVIPPGDPYANL